MEMDRAIDLGSTKRFGGDSWSSLFIFTSDVYPMAPTKSDRAHRVLGQVVGEFQLRIVQEVAEPAPKPQRVIAGIGESAFGQGAGNGRLDLFE